MQIDVKNTEWPMREKLPFGGFKIDNCFESNLEKHIYCPTKSMSHLLFDLPFPAKIIRCHHPFHLIVLAAQVNCYLDQHLNLAVYPTYSHKIQR